MEPSHWRVKEGRHLSNGLFQWVRRHCVGTQTSASTEARSVWLTTRLLSELNNAQRKRGEGSSEAQAQNMLCMSRDAKAQG
eukprot:1383897-Amorphochlora_amoeboformis.AAC.1